MGEQYAARLVDLYDADNPDGPDHDYYRELAARHAANSILDLGCGTGILTVTFAGPGRRVTGVDPSAAMLGYARRRPGAQAVRWVHGDSRLLPDGPYDLMVMTGNVAQHIADPQWQRTLSDLRARAAAGAVLAFESRNPAARAWETWGQEEPEIRHTPHGPLAERCTVTEQGHGRVLLRFDNHFLATGERIGQETLLTFRDRSTLARQLHAAGFKVSAVWGTWRRTPFRGHEPIMVFEARAWDSATTH